MTEDAPPTSGDDELQGLIGSLRLVLRTGLPLQPDATPDELLHLSAVVARSVDPGQRLARVDALERLLRAELKQLGLVGLRKPAQALFGFGASAGLTLTDRRHKAATLASYELNHFRKRIEPKICRQLAWQLHQDGLQYVRRTGDGQPLAASGPTPTIHEEHIDRPDAAEKEALLSRIWSDVYGLRSELILREAARDDPELAHQFTEAEAGSEWYLARLLTNLDRYMDRYGATILHGAAEHDARSLIRLAGWTGDLTEPEARDLQFRLARSGEWDRATFIARSRPVDA
ncbi:hypothetical protein LRS13_12580 [Svornostia abyssi]|uniref:Uncharacterized protein n=1 Tax=Svornostia abyssi TaxID=2898438 RepID=A0ABY5PAP6_9ACTN|nr:hypothetical protein LRS13_12580 [Parviterribacteraceae bacterium J379]